MAGSMAGMMEARSWTEQELRTMIFNEVTQGNTVQSLNESMRTSIGETHSGFVETMKNLEQQASRIVVQEREMKTMRDEVSRILEDNQTFVTRVENEQSEAQAKLALELDASHTQQQAIVTFVETLQPQVVDLQGHCGRASSAEGRRDREAGPDLRREGAGL